jgi:hypothetical protein
LYLLGIPWILSSESSLFKGLRATWREKIGASPFGDEDAPYVGANDRAGDDSFCKARLAHLNSIADFQNHRKEILII